jgi:uncharacterized protein YndB with AHSA1/START domain
VKFTVQSEIARPPAEVFDRMADARNEPSWNDQVTRSELTSGEPIGSGSRFVTVNRGKSFDSAITTYESPSRLGFEVTGKQFDITISFTVTESGDGSHVVEEFDFRPKGAMKAMFPLMHSAVRKDLAKQSQSFKRFCEQPPSA